MRCESEPDIVNISDASITSPNYPDYSPDSLNCKMLLIVKEGKTISLQFFDLYLEKTEWWASGKCYDWIDFFDGNDANSTALKLEFCSDSIPDKPITSTGNSMFIQFHSKGYGSKALFKFRPATGKAYWKDRL